MLVCLQLRFTHPRLRDKIVKIFDIAVTSLTLLCRLFGVTPDSIAAIKNKSKAPQVTQEVAAARVKSQIVS